MIETEGHRPRPYLSLFSENRNKNRCFFGMFSSTVFVFAQRMNASITSCSPFRFVYDCSSYFTIEGDKAMLSCTLKSDGDRQRMYISSHRYPINLHYDEDKRKWKPPNLIPYSPTATWNPLLFLWISMMIFSTAMVISEDTEQIKINDKKITEYKMINRPLPSQQFQPEK